MTRLSSALAKYLPDCQDIDKSEASPILNPPAMVAVFVVVEVEGARRGVVEGRCWGRTCSLRWQQYLH